MGSAFWLFPDHFTPSLLVNPSCPRMSRWKAGSWGWRLRRWQNPEKQSPAAPLDQGYRRQLAHLASAVGITFASLVKEMHGVAEWSLRRNVLPPATLPVPGTPALLLSLSAAPMSLPFVSDFSFPHWWSPQHEPVLWVTFSLLLAVTEYAPSATPLPQPPAPQHLTPQEFLLR